MTVESTGGQNDNVVALENDESTLRSETLYTKALRRILHDRLTLVMMGFMLLLIIFSLSANLIEQALGVSYTKTHILTAFEPFNSRVTYDDGAELWHILGTDDLGRDQLARLAYAGRITLSIAVVAALLSVSIGVSIGIIAGFYGGLLDDFVMWVITTLNSIPQLFLLIIMSAVLSPGPVALILILGFLGWSGTTRLVRGQTFSLREQEYVIGARAIGASDMRIMTHHIAPNLYSLVIIDLALSIGGLMLTEAALSFLGLGVQPPTPTWGNMLSNSQTFFTHGPHLVLFPGLLISITVLCLFVIGDGIRDAFDPTISG
jgi:peptide/nickel transport system permease protein